MKSKTLAEGGTALSLLSSTAPSTQVFVLNEETQLLGCFMVFVGTMYSQAGDAIGKALDAKSDAVIA